LGLNNGDTNILNLISNGLGDDGVLVIYGETANEGTLLISIPLLYMYLSNKRRII